MFRILFACTGVAGRSLMAEQFAARISPNNVEVMAVSDTDHATHPIARQALREVGMDLPEKAILMKDVLSEQFDIVITLCMQLEESCPQFPGSPARIHWGLMNPSLHNDNEDDLIYYFRRIRDEIKNRIHALFDHGYLYGIIELRNTYGQILDTMTDGVLAHDERRKVFYINNAAEEILGIKRGKIIGNDCHEVIPDFICGENCAYCSKEKSEIVSFESFQYSATYEHPEGQNRELELSVSPLTRSTGNDSGALVIFRDRTEITRLRNRLKEKTGYQGMIGNHRTMQSLLKLIQDLSKVNVSVLIQGESGTGKEMVARALHELSARRDQPFVPVNCGALPEGILESELFGHVKGAFTGATRDKKGRFELADKGVLFLDEIGEISQSMQVKILRVLQEKSFEPVGSEKTVKVDARVICATNKNLKDLIRAGTFREDLYYRLAVVPIVVAPLRERRTDITLLVDHFLDIYSKENNIDRKEFSPDALNCLFSYNWPGNIRELANAIQYSLVRCDTLVIQSSHLPLEIQQDTKYNRRKRRGRHPKLVLADVQRAMRKAGGKKILAAKMLGISRTTLYRYLDLQ
ncbi:MAG: sigma 54-interacting transcriptional regulator [Candidatus Electryonea clarkiae]|nr:sigma 54-interacting transcriptional regulator [Candidatus Electryonea clarkiae]